MSIDSIAGPSEILVIADDSANPRFVAADLLSQAEHDELASSILVTTSMELARKVSDEVDGFLKVLSRSDIIKNPWTITVISWWRNPWKRQWRQPTALRRSTWKSSPGIPLRS